MANRTRSRRSFIAAGTQAAVAATFAAQALPASAQSRGLSAEVASRFRRIRTQFIAALADPTATAGSNAGEWGLWRLDPGPRGVPLGAWEHLERAAGRAPSGWQFDTQAWWLEEHGLIMEAPEFPLADGEYLVTGDREAVSVLSVRIDGGERLWQLSDGANIHDVTHLRCRAARYTSASPAACTPQQAKQSDFPVSPGAAMPLVSGCEKQDYAVLLVIGRPVAA